MPNKPTPILVKRYAGSRLYDTMKGRYVTPADLSAWAAKAVSFVIVDAESGADITRIVLA